MTIECPISGMGGQSFHQIASTRELATARVRERRDGARSARAFAAAVTRATHYARRAEAFRAKKFSSARARNSPRLAP
jgi:hypothetical protein